METLLTIFLWWAGLCIVWYALVFTTIIVVEIIRVPIAIVRIIADHIKDEQKAELERRKKLGYH